MTTKPQRRPFFAWVILAWVLLGTVALVAGYATVLGFIPAADPETIDRYRAIGVLHWPLSAIGGGLNLFAAVLLVRGRGTAPYLFAAAFGLIIADTAYLFAVGDLETVFPHVMPMILGIMVQALIVGYSFNLKIRGRLT